MFNKHDLAMLAELTEGRYRILIANGHDVRLQSLTTGHEWIIISNFANRHCRIRHRHSCNHPFHEHCGLYETINGALAYIEIHDEWFAAKQKARREALPFVSRQKGL